MKVKHLDHINLTVKDLDETIAWYGRVFGFEPTERGVQEGIRWAVIRGGEAMLCIYEYPEHEHLDRFRRGDRGLHGVNHFSFRIDDPSEWLATVEREEITLSYGGVIEWPHSNAWYVTDPTGYEIEVAHWKEGRIAFPE